MAADADHAGAVVVRADGGSLAAPSDGFADVVAEIRAADRCDPADDPAAGRVVLSSTPWIARGLEKRIRDELTAAPPGDGMAVLADRSAPGDAWSESA